jgi:hypothetical protein
MQLSLFDLHTGTPWWWRQYAPLKRRSTIILHGSISQKTTMNKILLLLSVLITPVDILTDSPRNKLLLCGPFIRYTCRFHPDRRGSYSEDSLAVWSSGCTWVFYSIRALYRAAGSVCLVTWHLNSPKPYTQIHCIICLDTPSIHSDSFLLPRFSWLVQLTV